MNRIVPYRSPIETIVDALSKYYGLSHEYKDNLLALLEHKYGYSSAYTDTCRKNMHKLHSLSKKNALDKYLSCTGDTNLLSHAVSRLSQFMLGHLKCTESGAYDRSIQLILEKSLLGGSPSSIQRELGCNFFYIDKVFRELKELTGHGRSDLLLLYSSLMDIEHLRPKIQIASDIDLYDYLKGF